MQCTTEYALYNQAAGPGPGLFGITTSEVTVKFV
jgi:hypothetical protein